MTKTLNNDHIERYYELMNDDRRFDYTNGKFSVARADWEVEYNNFKVEVKRRFDTDDDYWLYWEALGDHYDVTHCQQEHETFGDPQA
jgi:hypothetical protein